MAAGGCLVDYKMTSSPTPTQKGKGQKQESSRKSELKTSKKNGGKDWKKPNAQVKVAERENSSQAIRPSECFICDGPHRVRDYPRKEKLNALIVEDEENNGSEVTTRANPLQLLNVIRAEATHKGLVYVELLTSG